MSKLEQVFVLKQFPVELKDVKKGDLFRVLMANEDGTKQFSEWHAALNDAAPKDDGMHVQADSIHFIVGRPDVVTISTAPSGEVTKKPVFTHEVREDADSPPTVQ